MTHGNDALIFIAVPGFTQFILDNLLEEYVYKEIATARDMEIPLWEKFRELSTETLVANSTDYYRSFLQAAATNKIRENIAESIKNYKNDLLHNINRDAISPEDFILTHSARKKSLMAFVTRYTTDPEEIVFISEEIDTLVCQYSVAATHAYVELVTQQAKEEKSIKDKLFSTSPGFYYIYDMVQDVQVLSAERLFETLGY
jgi:hypothetical protein